MPWVAGVLFTLFMTSMIVFFYYEIKEHEFIHECIVCKNPHTNQVLLKDKCTSEELAQPIPQKE